MFLTFILHVCEHILVSTAGDIDHNNIGGLESLYIKDSESVSRFKSRDYTFDS